MSSNYPAGVSDAHPHFNPAPVSASAVECGADEALVVPSFKVKTSLTGILLAMRGGYRDLAEGMIEKLLEQVTELEQEREYECPFNDQVDLEESECAIWDCPVCGNERETDNAPEERDPDYEYDRRGDND